MKATPSTLALVLLGLSVALYIGVVSPLSASLMKANGQLAEAESRLASIELVNGQSEEVKKRIAECTKTNEAARATLISPLLNSYAMSVKALVDDMALKAGMTNLDYGEGTLLALPVPKERAPENRVARRTVRITALADYAAVASFILRAEKELPLMTVQSVTINASKSVRPEQQDVVIVLEWPGKGEATP